MFSSGSDTAGMPDMLNDAAVSHMLAHNSSLTSVLDNVLLRFSSCLDLAVYNAYSPVQVMHDVYTLE